MRYKTYTKKDFAWAKWGAKDIERHAPKLVAEFRKNWEAVKKVPPEKTTFENTVLALESADYGIADGVSAIEFLQNVHPDRGAREAAKRAEVKMQKEIVETIFDEGVYKAVRAYADKKEKLAGEEKKLFDDMLRDYRRMGFELDRSTRAKLKRNLKKLNELATEFSKNINDYDDHILVSEKEAEGFPETYLEGLRRDKKGNYIVSLDYPEFFPFLQNAKSEKKRRELIDKGLRKGGEKNIAILKEVLRLRDLNAKLLGYKNHAAFRTEVRMVGTPERANAFMKGPIARLKPKMGEEIKELRDFKRKETGNPKAELQYFDLLGTQASYWMTQLKKQKFAVDDEEVREYFPFENVRRGIFRIYETLLSVKFAKLSGYPTWHRDVEVFGVREGKRTIAYFMLDMYPREGKYGHAAVFSIVSGRTGGGKYTPPVSCLVMNVKKPTKTTPSLLTHDEVETFFHEFGHVVHSVLTKAKYASQSGTRVKRDFVEAPSQMLENWVWDEKMLEILSGHYKNPKKKLPKKLLENMLAAKHFMIAYWATRQLAMAMFDMEIHTKLPKRPVTKIYDETILKYMGYKMPRGHIWPAGFGHLMEYDAGYYGYMFSRVYAADMFTRFEKEGLLERSVGADYRKWILEKGSSMEETELVTRFLGRKPNNKAFLKEIGL